MTSAEMTTLDLLRIKVLQNKGYDIIKKTLSRDSN